MAWKGVRGVVAIAAIGVLGSLLTVSQASSVPGTWHRVEDPSTASAGDAVFSEGWGRTSMLEGRPPGYRVDDRGEVSLRGVALATGASPAMSFGEVRIFAAFQLPCEAAPQAAAFVPTTVTPMTIDGESVLPLGVVAANLWIQSSGAVLVTIPTGVAIQGDPATFTGLLALDAIQYDARPASGLGSCDDDPMEIWVDAVNGSDDATGTATDPLATVARAFEVVRPVDDIVLVDGEHPVDGPLSVATSGAPGDPIELRAAPGADPVLEWTGTEPPESWQALLNFDATAHWSVDGVDVHGSPTRGIQCNDCEDMTFTQIEVSENGDHGISCQSCERTTWDRVSSHHNEWAGLQLIGEGTTDNIVQKSDFFENRDPDYDFENADGADINFGSGSGNQFLYNRSWENADDGFDAFGFGSPVTYIGNWSFRNGVAREGEDPFEGDGQGFKAGGDGTQDPPGVAHTYAYNLAFQNGANGFHGSGQPGPMHIWNNAAWGNAGRGFNFFLSNPNATTVPQDARNNLVFGSLGTAPMNTADDHFSPALDSSVVNSWSLTNVTIDEDDFVSLDPTGADGPRGADGSLPSLDLMCVASTSELYQSAQAISGEPYPTPNYGACQD